MVVKDRPKAAFCRLGKEGVMTINGQCVLQSKYDECHEGKQAFLFSNLKDVHFSSGFDVKMS